MVSGLTLLVAAGEPPEEATLLALCNSASRIIAVDGGLAHLRRVGVAPSLVVGDLDSAVSDDLEWARRAGSEIVHQGGQDESDLAKALNLCSLNSWLDVHATAIEGGRIDHQFGGIAALARAPPNLSIRASWRESTMIRVNAGGSHTMDFKGIFSLFSGGTTVVTVLGAEWELMGEEMEFSTRGLSNEARGELYIEVHSGDPLLLILNRM